MNSNANEGTIPTQGTGTRGLSIEQISVACIAAAYLITLLWILPDRVLMRSDDFAYVDVVAQTHRTGEWSISDWLEPLNLSLPVLSLATLHLSDNMFASTLGLNAFLSILCLVLLRALLGKTWPASVASVAALAFAIFPVFLNKAVEYTGVPFGLACTLAAILAWRAKRPAFFYTIVIIGFLNRQSALLLLILPSIDLLLQWRRTGRPPVLAGAILLSVTATIGGILISTPPNWARAHVPQYGFEHLPTAAANIALAVIVLSAVRAIVNLISGESIAETWKANLARPIVPLAVSLSGAAIVLTGFVDLRFETPGVAPFGKVIIASATAIGAWLHRWNQLPPLAESTYCVAYVVLVSWRGIWWDYYFLEVACILLATRPPTLSVKPQALWPLVILLAIGATYAPLLRQHLQNTADKMVAYEHALRDGSVDIQEMSDAPFGMLAWKLFHTAKMEPDARQLADFLKYVDGGRGHYFEGELIIDRTGKRKSLHPTHEKWSLPPGFQPRVTPLNSSEWQTYLRPRTTPPRANHLDQALRSIPETGNADDQRIDMR